MNQTYHISDSEWLVLRCLWKQSPMEIKDIVAMLQKETGWNANMVRTLVVRLQDKGVIAAEKGGRYYRYYPVAEERQCIQEETQSFLNRVFEGSPAKMMAALTGGGQICDKEITEIQRLLDELKERGGK